jgi:Tfp pilus assembly protein PilF
MRVFRSVRGLPTGPEGTPGTSAAGAPLPGRSRRVAMVVVALFAVVGGAGLGWQLWLDARFDAAERALEQRHFAEARAQLDLCRSFREDHPDDLLLAVRIARRSGARDETDTLIRAYVQKCARDAAIEREYRLAQLQRGNVRDVDQALTNELTRTNATDPWELEAALVGAMEVLFIAFINGNTAPGQPAYPFLCKVQAGAERWLRLRPSVPDQVEGLVWRGRTRAYSNDRVGAPADLRSALDLDPEHRDARLQLALILQQEQPVEAAEHMARLMRRYPDDLLLKFYLGEMHRSAGRTEQARGLLDEILAAKPEDISALMARGWLALEVGEYARAEQCLSRAHQLAPNDSRTNFGLATCLKATGRAEEARAFHELYMRAIEDQRAQFERTGLPAP